MENQYSQFEKQHREKREQDPTKNNLLGSGLWIRRTGGLLSGGVRGGPGVPRDPEV